MSSISSTPRRPSTALPTLNPLTPLSTRMPYEAAEALLWERQNARANTHLHSQMKALQSAHDAYDARISATEAITEAAEAALSSVRMLGRKVEALEADEREGPFVGWAKEAVGQLQGSVEGLKGIRGRIGAVEREVESLGEDVNGVKGVVRRLEELEGERREEGRRFRELERWVEKMRSEGCGRVDGEVVEETCGETQADDNPLAVFYGIETQSTSRRQESLSRRQDHGRAALHQDCSPSRRTESPQRQYNNLQPLNEDIAHPDDIVRPDDSFGLLEAAPEGEYGWENTQQFKDMQKELAALRAMCRIQEPKSSNETADATQRPQETLIVGRENVDFSDATTETEAEYDDRNRSRGSIGVLSSDIRLPSSPPKRTETQSARRNLMKRPSIYDPRVPSLDDCVLPKQSAPTPREEPADSRPPLLVKLPVETRTANIASAKRKHVDDAPAQRVTRPRLSDDRTAPRKNKTIEESAFDERVPLTLSETPAPVSPPRKTYPTVKSRKTISKPKPVLAQQQLPEAASSSSKQTPAAVKRETKGPRQPVGACKSCRLRHQKCDRTLPACGRCAKLSTSCEYPQNPVATAQTASNPRKKQAPLTIKKSANEGRESVLRGRSVTVSPEPRQKSPAKRAMPMSPSKKSTVAAAPTAASSRAPRAKKTQTSRAAPQKK